MYIEIHWPSVRRRLTVRHPDVTLRAILVRALYIPPNLRTCASLAIEDARVGTSTVAITGRKFARSAPAKVADWRLCIGNAAKVLAYYLVGRFRAYQTSLDEAPKL